MKIYFLQKKINENLLCKYKRGMKWIQMAAMLIYTLIICFIVYNNKITRSYVAAIANWDINQCIDFYSYEL